MGHRQKGIAYGFQMGLRPQTLYGIADSPVGLAAYFLDHDKRSYEHAVKEMECFRLQSMGTPVELDCQDVA
jgi:hypothetical protein